MGNRDWAPPIRTTTASTTIAAAVVVETTEVSTDWTEPTYSDTGQSTTVTVEQFRSLERSFRLLLKAWLVTGLPLPAGLEDEIPEALTTD